MDDNNAPPDLQALVAAAGGYEKISPEMWAAFDRGMAEWRAQRSETLRREARGDGQRSRLSPAPVRPSSAGRIKLASIAVPRRVSVIAATVGCDGSARKIDSRSVGQMHGDDQAQI
jgi:hypothetical protein